MPRTDLREILGDRYDEVIAKAGRILHDDDDVNGERCGLCELHAEPVLAAVLPDLLADARREGQADAWDEGHEAGWDDLAARSSVPDLTDTPNPYRAAHAAAHSAAQGVPTSQCGPDAARPADGIVRGTHYGTEGGER